MGRAGGGSEVMDTDNSQPSRYPRQTFRTTEIRKGIYVAGFGPYVKIGVSTDVYERVATIQAPEELKIYAILDGWITKEKQLHRRFSAYRLRGEWFKHEGELAKWIAHVSDDGQLKTERANRGRTKLTEAQVAEIRAAKGVPRRELAAKYGVGKTQIRNVRLGKNWAHVD